MFLKFIVFCVLLTVVDGKKRTCFCSYKIGYDKDVKTSDKVGNTWWEGFAVTCGYVEKRCPDACKSNAQKYLSHPESSQSQTGKDVVCRLYGKSNTKGIGVWSGSEASSCQGYPRYKEIVATGKICCYRTCSSCTMKYQVKNEQQITLNIYIYNPSISPSYSCDAEPTLLCETDCKTKLRQSSFGRTSVDSYSGQKVCTVLNKAIPTPGAKVSVSYDIGDDHSHQFPVGTTCCGCTCSATYTQNGVSKPLPVSISQPYGPTSYFPCSYQDRNCKSSCMSAVQRSLGVDAALGQSVCNKLKQPVPTPGTRVDVTYNIGESSNRSSTVPGGNVCCGCTCSATYTQNGVSKSLPVSISQPHRPTSYFHCSYQDRNCKSSCMSAVQRSLGVSRFTVDTELGQSVCSKLKKPVPTPGIRVDVTYNIGESSNRRSTVPGGNVCCGCTCSATYTQNGASKSLPVSISQPYRPTSYFHCSYQDLNCKSSCMSAVQRSLSRLTVDAALGQSVCSKLKNPVPTPGIRVDVTYNIGESSNRRSTVPVGYMCCGCTCSATYTQNGVGKSLPVSISQPYGPTSYFHCSNQDRDCKSSCMSAVQRSLGVSRLTVDAALGQSVCSKLKKPVPTPGTRVDVTYNIGEPSNRLSTVPGGNVCCGCKCRASYSYGGQNYLLKETFSQPHATKYFSCGSHNTSCSDLCRTLVKDSLSTTPPTTIEDTVGYKVCREYGKAAQTSPGIQMYVEYDIGRGFVKEKMENFCCVTVPPTLVFSYKC